MTFDPGQTYTLDCQAAEDLTAEIKSVLFWTFGFPDAHNTTVIGRRTSPRLSVEMKVDSCFQITAEGSLLLINCSQETTVRYWCNVFPEGGDLQRSYVDVVIASK